MENVHPLTFDLLAEMMMVDSLTESARTTLTGIANQCPLDGGDAVFQARAMLEPALYADAENCVPVAEREARVPESRPAKEAGISVCPNPSSGWLTLLSEQVCTADCIGQLSVLDSRGAAVFSLPVDLSLRTQQIDLRSFPSGIYLVRITQNGRPLFTDQIVFNH